MLPCGSSCSKFVYLVSQLESARLRSELARHGSDIATEAAPAIIRPQAEAASLAAVELKLEAEAAGQQQSLHWRQLHSLGGSSPASSMALPLIAGLKSCHDGLDHHDDSSSPAYRRAQAAFPYVEFRSNHAATETISALLGKFSNSVHTEAAATAGVQAVVGGAAAAASESGWAFSQHVSLGLVSISELHEALQCISDYHAARAASQNQPQLKCSRASRTVTDPDDEGPSPPHTSHGPGPTPAPMWTCESLEVVRAVIFTCLQRPGSDKVLGVPLPC